MAKVLLFVICLALIIAGSQPVQALSSPTQTVSQVTFPIEVPATLEAGQPLSLKVGPLSETVKEGTIVKLVWLGNYAPRLYRSTVRSQVATFEIPAKDTQQAGQVSLIVRLDNMQATTSFAIKPTNVAEPLLTLPGERSIVADGEQSSSLVALPVDAFGNPVAEGTPVRVEAFHPDGRTDLLDLQVRQGLVTGRVVSGKVAGRTTVILKVGNIASPNINLLETAGIPASVSLEMPRLDGRQTVNLRTAPIKDKFNNIIPDGALVTFITDGPNGQRRAIPTYAIEGVAEASITAPTQSQQVAVWVIVGGVESGRLELNAGTGLSGGNLSIVMREDRLSRAYLLEAAPLLASSGQFLPDGTPVVFQISGANGMRELTAFCQQGRAWIEVYQSGLSAGSYQLQVAAGKSWVATSFTVN